MVRPVSQFAGRLRGGGRAMELHDEARRRLAAGKDVMLLTVGDTDLDTPAGAVEAGVSAILGGRTHYPDRWGERALRAAIAERHASMCGVAQDPAHVLVAAGAQQALFLTLLSIVDPGDEVLVLDPYYAHHASAVRACGAVPVPVPLSMDGGFRLLPGTVGPLVGPRTKAFIFNTPHNPTGRVFDAAETDEVVRACVANDLWVVSDEVYADLRFGKDFVPPASLPGMAARTAAIGSLSKSHAMTGWRVGWAVLPPSLAPHAARVSALASLGVPPFAQDAALVALREGAGHVPAAIGARRATVAHALSGLPGLRASAPESGPFFFLDVRGTGLSGTEFCWGLLDGEGVALVPGEGFGDGGYGHARLSLSVPEARLAEACSRIARHLRSLAASRAHGEGALALTAS